MRRPESLVLYTSFNTQRLPLFNDSTLNDSTFKDSALNDSTFRDSTLNDSTLNTCILSDMYSTVYVMSFCAGI
jgi:hypothetical protein